MRKKAPAAIGFIFFTILIDCIGFGVVIPVIPNLITSLIQGSLSEASVFGGFLMFAYASMQFLFSPVLGNLSDQFGRRPILLISLFGFALDYLFTAFAPSLVWLFLGRIIAGITGASFTTATAYIADISAPDKKAQNFGIVGAAFGLGFIIGPVIGGLLTSLGPWLSSINPRFQTLGLRLPFLFSAFLSFLNWLYGYFILPESLALVHRKPFSWRNANPLGSLLLLKKYRSLLGLVAAFLLIYLGGSSVMTTWSYYNMEKFGWHEKEVGLSLGVVGIMVAFVQGFLMRKTLPFFGQERSVYIGLACYTLGLILFALATQGWMMYAFTIIYCLGGISGPALQGIISNHVPPNEQGALQGALTSLISLSSILGPLMMTGLFSYYTSPRTPLFFPGASFMMGALLMISSLYFSYRTLFTEKHQVPANS